MADDSGLMAEFEEFLKAKQAREAEESESEDFDVEIWNEKGAGVRTKRSHAKPFLQSLGLDLDPEPAGDDNDKDKNKPGDGKAKPTGKTAQNQGVARKYFTSQKKN